MTNRNPARPRRGVLGVLVEPLNVVAATVFGVAVAAITAGFYFMASGRSLDFDSSVTVGAFVKTDSLLDPLRRQIALNNHPLFSVLEHVMWSAGFHTETWLRTIPILFGVLTVGVISAWCARLWGALAGLSAGAVIAANPMFAELSRELRGYSMLTFCAVVSTTLLWRLIKSPPESTPWWVGVAYVVFVAAGISTHLYGTTVLIVHFGIVVARRDLSVVWIRRFVGGAFFGSLIYLKTLHAVLNTGNDRVFYSKFPREVVVPLLGQALVAVIALGIVVVWALWLLRARKDVLGGVAAVLFFVAFVWIVVQPEFLVFRYLTWLIPGVAFAAAFLVRRKPAAIVLVAIAVGAMVVHESPSWTATEVPTSETAAVIDAARAEGLQVCGIFHTAVAVLAYTRQPARPQTVAENVRCDLAVGFYVTPALDRSERGLFPYSWQIPGDVPAFIYSRQPEASVIAGMKRARDTLDTNPRTWPS